MTKDDFESRFRGCIYGVDEQIVAGYMNILEDSSYDRYVVNSFNNLVSRMVWWILVSLKIHGKTDCVGNVGLEPLIPQQIGFIILHRENLYQKCEWLMWMYWRFRPHL